MLVLFTYWLITVMLGIVGAVSVVEFSVCPLPHPASSWRLLQNLTAYGVIATLAYLHAFPASATTTAQAATSAPNPSPMPVDRRA